MTDGTLPVPGDSVEGKKKKLKILSLQNYVIQENLPTVFANCKYKQNLRTADII
jgi:hypothetical protein